MSSSKSIYIAQSLYEGVDLSEGKTALISYIRTDSTRVNPDSIKDAREQIKNKFGEKYLPKTPNYYKTKKSAQDAHEAIRPIDASLDPSDVKQYLTSDQYKLYKLIYERFLASQMEKAVYTQKQVLIKAGEYLFKTTGRTIDFKGYTKIYETKSDDKVTKLPEMNKNDKLNLINLDSKQKFTQPPQRYSEAKLVKVLEENGVGRPSTYAHIISTLVNRKYVVKENKSLVPTDIAFKVMELLEKFFDKIIKTKFTAQMENKLDDVASSKITNWKKDVIADFYSWFKDLIDQAYENAKSQKESPKETDIICDKCGAKMLIRNGRNGKFLGCSNFPKCKNTKSLDENMQVKEEKREQKVITDCPKCDDGKIVEKIANTKRGRKKMYGCTNYPKCDFAVWNEILDEKCPKCGWPLVKKQGEDKDTIYCSNKKCDYKKDN
ncbi:MAG: DNA topoisomerase, partial [Candidatus Woesearchaeota archaeon]